MSDDPSVPGGTPDTTPAGTECALCGTDLPPSEYPDCRAVLIDESGPGDDDERIEMVCADCLSDLDDELTDPSESRSPQSV